VRVRILCFLFCCVVVSVFCWRVGVFFVVRDVAVVFCVCCVCAVLPFFLGVFVVDVGVGWCVALVWCC